MATVQAVLGAAPGTTPTVEGVTAAQIAAAQRGSLQAYADAFAYVYYTIIPFTVAAAIGTCKAHLLNYATYDIDAYALYCSVVLPSFRETYHELEH